MHLFLIRHGETEHNIAGLLAGVSDSRLTNHGALQTQRLGDGLVRGRGIHFTSVYSSDLQRAFLTANEICKAQNKGGNVLHEIEVAKLEVLREQDFGSLELVPWSSRRAQQASDSRVPSPDDPEYKPKETTEAMRRRADSFLDNHLVPLFAIDHELENIVAVVSHGLFLAQLWRALLARFNIKNVIFSSAMASDISSRPFEHMAWSNTGYLELQIRSAQNTYRPSSTSPPPKSDADQETSVFAGATMAIQSINDKRHLLSLKRSRGGIGSATHDRRQQNLETFFKKRKAGGADETKIKADGDDATEFRPQAKRMKRP